MNRGVSASIGIGVIVASALQLGLLVRGFSAESAAPAMPTAQAVAVEPGVGPTLVTASFVPERVVIPAAGIDLPVVVSPLQGDTWPVRDGVANFADGTSLVNGQTGNTGLFAHDRADGFTAIKRLQTNDLVTVTGAGYVAEYRVVSTSVVAPETVSVFEPTAEPQLTLITCDGVFSNQRYVVHTSLVSLKESR